MATDGRTVPAIGPVEESVDEICDTAAGNPRGHDGHDEELIDVDALVAKQPYDFARDVAWVYEHLADRNVKPQDAPTAGAWSLLTWARRYKNRFFEQVLPKAMLNKPSEADENLREAELRATEIELVLKKFDRKPPK